MLICSPELQNSCSDGDVSGDVTMGTMLLIEWY